MTVRNVNDGDAKTIGWIEGLRDDGERTFALWAIPDRGANRQATTDDLAAAGYVSASDLEAVRLELSDTVPKNEHIRALTTARDAWAREAEEQRRAHEAELTEQQAEHERVVADWHKRWMQTSEARDALSEALLNVAKERTTERNRAEKAVRSLVDHRNADSKATGLLLGSLKQAEDDCEKALAQRDYNADVADELAAAIGGEGVGEHTSTNEPWQVALAMADGRVLFDELAAANARAGRLEGVLAEFAAYLHNTGWHNLAEELVRELNVALESAPQASTERIGDTQCPRCGSHDKEHRGDVYGGKCVYPWHAPAVPQASTELPNLDEFFSDPGIGLPIPQVSTERVTQASTPVHSTREEADEAMGDYVESYPIGAHQASTEQPSPPVDTLPRCRATRKNPAGSVVQCVHQRNHLGVHAALGGEWPNQAEDWDFGNPGLNPQVSTELEKPAPWCPPPNDASRCEREVHSFNGMARCLLAKGHGGFHSYDPPVQSSLIPQAEQAGCGEPCPVLGPSCADCVARFSTDDHPAVCRDCGLLHSDEPSVRRRTDGMTRCNDCDRKRIGARPIQTSPIPQVAQASEQRAETESARALLDYAQRALMGDSATGVGQERVGVAVRYVAAAVLAVTQDLEALRQPKPTEPLTVEALCKALRSFRMGDTDETFEALADRLEGK